MATITCTIPSGNDYRHYLTTLAYLQDINDGMPQFFKDLLANQVELDKHIPQSLQENTLPSGTWSSMLSSSSPATR